MSKRILVVGLGVFGKALARELYKSGLDVIAIDHRMEMIENIKDEVSLAVSMDSTDERALRTLNPEDIDIALVTIGENFEANLLTSVQLKELGVKYVIARASKPLQKKILYKSGVDLIITPEEIVAHLLSQDFLNSTNIVASYIEKFNSFQ